MGVQPAAHSATSTAWPIPLPPPVTIAVRMLFDMKWRSLAVIPGLFFSIDEFDAGDDFGDRLSTLQKQKIFASFWE
jgi:hypothetical protein